MVKLFENKITLVSGSSLQTIALVIRTFIREGATVIFPAKSASEIVWLKSSLTDLNCDKLVTLITDYPDYYKASEIAETIMEQFGKIDFAFVCFDRPIASGDITDTNIEDWEKMLDQHLTAYFTGVRIAFDLMKENSQAMVICISHQINPEHVHNDLADLEFLMQKEMTVMFSKKFKTKKIGFYHILLCAGLGLSSTINRDASSKASPETENIIGKYIIQLQQEDAENGNALFHWIA